MKKKMSGFELFFSSSDVGLVHRRHTRILVASNQSRLSASFLDTCTIVWRKELATRTVGVS